MNTYKINYSVKNTRSNNTYINIDNKDKNIFLLCVLSINSYMQELCLSQDVEIKQFTNWYRSPDKKFPYNKRLERRNSPESMLAGVINNMMFGKQDDLSLEQLPYYEEIINSCADVIEELRLVKKIDLQHDPAMTKIIFGLGI